jgi:hypothetical protein
MVTCCSRPLFTSGLAITSSLLDIRTAALVSGGDGVLLLAVFALAAASVVAVVVVVLVIVEAALVVANGPERREDNENDKGFKGCRASYTRTSSPYGDGTTE